jgi:hypothetical protein
MGLAGFHSPVFGSSSGQSTPCVFRINKGPTQQRLMNYTYCLLHLLCVLQSGMAGWCWCPTISA